MLLERHGHVNSDLPKNVPAPPTRQAAAIEGRSRRGAVTGKLKVALDAMVWDRLPYAEAAAKAGLAANSVRSALRKPHCVAYYRGERQALLASLQPKNIHRLDAIADGSGNDMARVSAIKQLETMDQVAAATTPVGSAQLVPGLCIVIQGSASSQPVVIAPPQPAGQVTIDQEPTH